MKPFRKAAFLIALILGGITAWGILSVIRTQFLLFFVSVSPRESKINEAGLFYAELFGLLVWLSIIGIPTILIARKVPCLKVTFLKGVTRTLIVCSLGIPFAVALFFILIPNEDITHYQSSPLTKVMIPKRTEQVFIPPRYSEFGSRTSVSEKGRVAVDAIVFSQIFALATLATSFWIRFSHKVLNKEEYARPYSILDWVTYLHQFHNNDQPEDPDRLEF